MSYILDALRRAESERANEKAPGLHDQPIEPLLPPERARPARSPWLWMLAGGGIVLVGGLAWAWFARSPGQPAPTVHEAAQPAPASPAAVSNVRPPAPAPVAQSTRPAGAPVVVVAPAPASPPGAQEPPPAPATTANAQTPPRVLPPPPKAAVPEPAPVPVEPADTRVPSLAQLPESVRRSLPELRFEGTVYSNDPASRMLMLNGQLLHEGDSAGNDLTVERIKQSSAVMNYHGQRFELTRQ